MEHVLAVEDLRLTWEPSGKAPSLRERNALWDVVGKWCDGWENGRNWTQDDKSSSRIKWTTNHKNWMAVLQRCLPVFLERLFLDQQSKWLFPWCAEQVKSFQVTKKIGKSLCMSLHTENAALFPCAPQILRKVTSKQPSISSTTSLQDNSAPGISFGYHFESTCTRITNHDTTRIHKT